MIAQLYVETHRMGCCASLLPANLQGSQCLLIHLGLSPLLDTVNLVGRPLGGEASGLRLALTPITPYLYPSVQVLALSPK